MRSKFVGVALAVSLVIVSGALAQNVPKIIRGEIVSVDGAKVAVRTRDNETVNLRLKDGQNIIAVLPAALSVIKTGVFIGAAAMLSDDGSLKAMEATIFPEAMRGQGEGFRPFDLAPGSTMTNANISSVVDRVSGPKSTLTYKGGEKLLLSTKRRRSSLLCPVRRAT